MTAHDAVPGPHPKSTCSTDGSSPCGSVDDTGLRNSCLSISVHKASKCMQAYESVYDKVDSLSAAAETCPRLPWRGYSPDRLHAPLTEGSSFNGDRMWTSKASPSGCQSLALRDILTASGRTSVGSGDGGCEDQRPDRHPFTPGTITPLHVRHPSNRSPSCRDSDAKRSDSR